MRAVIQRVREASVTVDGERIAAIGAGLLVLLGVGRWDDEDDARWMAEKIPVLRLFEDEEGRLNRSLTDIGGELLVVSQFTLYGDCMKGRRPSFSGVKKSAKRPGQPGAAAPEEGRALYLRVCTLLRESGLAVATGQFQATMDVALINDGPVTMIVTSPKEEERALDEG